jgi:hypothetical protein
MSKLTEAHLKPLATAFIQALNAGEIPLSSALDFVDAVCNATLERRVYEHERKKKLHPTKPMKE